MSSISHTHKKKKDTKFEQKRRKSLQKFNNQETTAEVTYLE